MMRLSIILVIAFAFFMNSIMSVPISSGSSSSSSHSASSQTHTGTIDCDSYFSDVVQIDEKMMNEFHDQELRHAYVIRNKNMGLCLEFYTKFLAKLDYYLNSLDALEIESGESKQDSSYEYDIPEKRQVKNKILKNKYFF